MVALLRLWGTLVWSRLCCFQRSVRVNKSSFIAVGCICFHVALLATSVGQRLIDAYPEMLVGVDDNELIWRDGTCMQLSDGKERGIQELLDEPDLASQFHWPYPRGTNFSVPVAPGDPGRIRCEPFFKKMYGSTKEDVEKNLVELHWLPSICDIVLRVTRINGVAERMQALSDELETHPEFYEYVSKNVSTFNWRVIAGTSRLSAHSFGTALDINSACSHYWRWEPEGVSVYKNAIPLELVEIFERHGFIWGGKWYHFDTMHFEYRPEMLLE